MEMDRRQFNLFGLSLLGSALLGKGCTPFNQPPPPPPNPNFDVESNLATLPGQFPADLRLVNNRLLGIMGDRSGNPAQNLLFELDLSSTARPIPASVLANINGMTVGTALNSLAPLPGSDRVVITSDDALYDVSLSNPTDIQRINLPSGNTFASGALVVGQRLFVNVSNLLDPFANSYGQGAMLVYQASSAGIGGFIRSEPTSDLNPTGFIDLTTEFGVLNSGPISQSGQPLGNASIDIFDSSGQFADNIQFGPLGGQLSGQVAVSKREGAAVFGTADNSGRLIFVNMNTGGATDVTLPGTRFHRIQIDDDNGLIFATDFNSGKLTIMDLIARSVIATIQLQPGAGPGVVVGGDLIQAIPNGAVRVFQI